MVICPLLRREFSPLVANMMVATVDAEIVQSRNLLSNSPPQQEKTKSRGLSFI